MGINIGALLAPLITGYLGERVGWHWGFGAAGIGMGFGLLQFGLCLFQAAVQHGHLIVLGLNDGRRFCDRCFETRDV